MLAIEKQTARDTSIDLIKTVCALFVIIAHTSYNGYYQNAVSSFNWVSTVFWGTIMRSVVPIFLMCSGALLLRPEKEITLKKIYAKMLPRMLVALLVWAFAYKMYYLLLEGFTWAGFVYAVKRVILFDHEFHLYYLHIVLLLYVCLPVIRLFVAHADKRLVEYALAIWFVLGIVYPTVGGYWPFTLLNGIPVQWMMNMAWAAFGYLLLGYYVKTWPLEKRWVYPLCFLGGFAAMFAGTWLMSVKDGVLYQHFLGGMTVFSCVKAFGFFGLLTTSAKAAELGGRRGVQYLSKASFCIFLAHPFFLYIQRGLGLDVDILPCLVSIPLLSLLNMACCTAVYFVISKIPVARKWLV